MEVLGRKDRLSVAVIEFEGYRDMLSNSVFANSMHLRAAKVVSLCWNAS